MCAWLEHIANTQGGRIPKCVSNMSCIAGFYIWRLEWKQNAALQLGTSGIKHYIRKLIAAHVFIFSMYWCEKYLAAGDLIKYESKECRNQFNSQNLKRLPVWTVTCFQFVSTFVDNLSVVDSLKKNCVMSGSSHLITYLRISSSLHPQLRTTTLYRQEMIAWP